MLVPFQHPVLAAGRGVGLPGCVIVRWVEVWRRLFHVRQGAPARSLSSSSQRQASACLASIRIQNTIEGPSISTARLYKETTVGCLTRTVAQTLASKIARITLDLHPEILSPETNPAAIHSKLYASYDRSFDSLFHCRGYTSRIPITWSVNTAKAQTAASSAVS